MRVSLTNGSITNLAPFGNGIAFDTTADAVLIVDGVEIGPGGVHTGNGPLPPPVSPGVPGVSSATGGYAGGGKQPGPASGNGVPAGGNTVAFVKDGITSVPYPAGNQQRWTVTGVVPGVTTFDLGTIPAGKHPGGGRFSLMGASIDACPITHLVMMSGGKIVKENWQSNHAGVDFQVGEDKGTGYGPRLTTDLPATVAVEFPVGVPTEISCEIAAHDKTA